MPSPAFTAVTDPTNLHKLISDLVVELITLRDHTTDPDQRNALKDLRDKLQARSLALLEQELDANTADFKKTGEALKSAAKAAKDAQEDLSKVAKTLKQVAQALKIVDKLLGVATSLIV